LATSRLHELSALGQSVWVDNLSRDLVHGGGLAKAIEHDAVVGVTSNPTIFQKALAQGEAYDTQLRELLTGDEDDVEVFFQLAGADVAAACDVLRPVYDATSGLDGYVSLEVDPRLSFDTDATVAQAVRLHEMVDRPNLLVKIPATEPGLAAIEEMIARGRSINVTLIFSLERYRAVAEAYVRGLERLVEGGGDPRPVASVASFFVSRVDTETDRRLTEIGGHDDLKGRLAVANAKLAYRDYLEIFSGERWDALRARGATPQRCLWASTSTKDPSYRDVLYVEELIGPSTVNTMPEETIVAFQDHGVSEVRLTQNVDAARELLTSLAAAGIDYDDVTATLEREGVEKFEDSFRDLLSGIQAKRLALVGA
jgi:transaldolase